MNAVMKRQDSIESLVAACAPGHSLPGCFYSDESIYRADVERIWRTGWLFAGHTCEAPKPGDYFLVELDTDSIIVVRDEAGRLRAWHNVCRHRGSLLCTESSGHVARLVCPYHQWTYRLNGELLAC